MPAHLCSCNLTLTLSLASPLYTTPPLQETLDIAPFISSLSDFPFVHITFCCVWWSGGGRFFRKWDMKNIVLCYGKILFCAKAKIFHKSFLYIYTGHSNEFISFYGNILFKCETHHITDSNDSHMVWEYNCLKPNY